MTCLIALLQLLALHSDSIPTDPVPVPDPIPRPQPMPDPPPMKNRLNCRIVSGDLRGYAPAEYEFLPRD